MSFLLLEINLLLKFDFLLKYEAYPIKETSDTWSFAVLYLPCGSFQRLRWSTAVWCRGRNLKPVHVIRKILWKTESVMIGKIVTFWRVKMQIWVIYGILLVNECCGTLGHCREWGLFCIVFYGSPWHRNDTIYVFTFSKAISIKHCFWHELLPLITNFWLEKNAKFAFLSSKRLPNMTKRLKGMKSVHASDESWHIMYVTETKITFCDYFNYFIQFWLHLDK